MEFKAELDKIPLKVEDGSYILSFSLGKNPHIAYDIFEQYMNFPVKVTVEKYREKRSDKANGMFWACITKLAEAMHMPNNEMYIRELKRYGKALTEYLVEPKALDVTLEKFREVWRIVEVVGSTKDAETNKEYYIVHCYEGSSDYNSKEFARLLSGVLEDMRDVGLDTENYIDKKQNTIENI